MNIFWAAIWFVILGGGFGLMLAFADKIFAVETDPRIELVTEALPSANCGGCGFVGCSALAEAIVNGNAKPNACPVGGISTAAKIAQIMGSGETKTTRYRAQVMCSGTNDLAKKKYEYKGINDCISANRLAGGAKTCPNGCLGMGSCAKNCKFDAIKIINGVAAVDYEKCKACGACVAACPKSIIKLIPFDATHWVGCMSVDKGAVTRKYCDIGCIACKICEKNCEANAIKINDFVAQIDYSKCTHCKKCEQTCPRKIIWSSFAQKETGVIREKENSGSL